MDHISESPFKLPQEWYEEGEEYLKKEELEKARNAFEKALELDPFYPQALCGISKILWKQGEFRESIEKLNKALEIDPNDPDVIKQCAGIFIQLGQKDDALEVLRSYLNRNPWDVEMEDFTKRVETESIVAGKSLPIPSQDIGSKTQKEDENNPADFLTIEGENQLEKQKIDRAKVCFEMALEHDPDHARAHNNLGVMLWNENKLEEALEHFQKAFSAAPDDKDIVFNSFHALVQAGEIEVAKDLMKLHIQKNPFNEEAWELYDTLSASSMTIHWSPENLSEDVADVYADMAKKLMKRGDLFGAAESLHRAILINPKHFKALKLLGNVHKELGHPEEAISFYKEALSENPLDEKLVSHFVDYLKELGKIDDARELAENFLKKKESPKLKKILEEL